MSSVIAETAELRWGYTMADVDRIVRHAINRVRQRSLVSRDDWYDDTWSGVIEALYRAERMPTVPDLINAGAEALAGIGKENIQAAGLAPDCKTVRPSFMKYWRPVATSDGDFTDHCTERLALIQVLALLTGTQYEVLAAVAVHGSVNDAARALGWSTSRTSAYLNEARDVILAAWYGPETPRSLKKRAEADGPTCRNGHDRAMHQYIDSQGAKGCRQCRRDSDRRRRARRSNEQIEKDREHSRVFAAEWRERKRAEALERGAA